MLRSFFAAAATAALLTGAALASDTSPFVTAAITDTGRPADDTARDASRKPAEMVTFAGIKPGDSVLEILPAAGLLHAHLLQGDRTERTSSMPPCPIPRDRCGAALPRSRHRPGYSNVTVVPIIPLPAQQMGPLDVIWTSWNYHDLHLSRVHVDMAQVDKGWFALLKPGGVVVIVDHAALPGSPAVETADKLHRIDPAVVKQEMTAAGFVFDGETNVLANPTDPHTAIVFDPSIRGKTDQFAYRFKKPN